MLKLANLPELPEPPSLLNEANLPERRDPADPPTLEDVRAFCEGRLAHYKVPSRLQILEAFPMTVSGKVRKVELREGYGEVQG